MKDAELVTTLREIADVLESGAMLASQPDIVREAARRLEELSAEGQNQHVLDLGSMPAFDCQQPLLPAGLDRDFGEIAVRLGMRPDELVWRMIAHVVEADADRRRLGLPGVGRSFGGEDAREVLALAGDTASDDIRPTEYIWPADQRFPWSDRHCAAAVRGYAVKWPGSRDKFLLLRRRWELVGGYASLQHP